MARSAPLSSASVNSNMLTMRPPRRRLGSDFYNNVSTHPSEDERVELAEAVRRVPRCDFYTPQKVYNWFLNSRTRAKRAGAAGTVPSSGGACSRRIHPLWQSTRCPD